MPNPPEEEPPKLAEGEEPAEEDPAEKARKEELLAERIHEQGLNYFGFIEYDSRILSMLAQKIADLKDKMKWSETRSAA